MTILRKPPFDAMGAYLDRWAATCMSCEPADRPLAEAGIRDAYAAAGLAPPDRIVWCGGPLEIAKRLASASADDPIGDNVKAEVFDRVREKVGTLAEIFGKEFVIAGIALSQHGTVRAALSEHNRCRAASRAVNRAVVGAVDASLCRLSLRVRHLALRWRGLPHLLPRSTFADIAIGPEQLASLGVYEYLHNVLPWGDITRPLQG